IQRVVLLGASQSHGRDVLAHLDADPLLIHAARLSIHSYPVPDADRARRQHPPVDAERNRLGGVQIAAIAPEQLEGRDVDLSALRVPGGYRAPAHMPLEPHLRLAYSDGAADPRVLRVGARAIDLDQHPEAPRVDLVEAPLRREALERGARDQ